MKNKIKDLYYSTGTFQTAKYSFDNPFRTYSELAFDLGIPKKYVLLDDVIEEEMVRHSPETLAELDAFTAELTDFFGETSPEFYSTKNDDELAAEILDSVVFDIIQEIRRMVGLLLCKKAPGFEVLLCDVIASTIKFGKVELHGFSIDSTDDLVSLIAASFAPEEHDTKYAELINRKKGWDRQNG